MSSTRFKNRGKNLKVKYVLSEVTLARIVTTGYIRSVIVLIGISTTERNNLLAVSDYYMTVHVLCLGGSELNLGTLCKAKNF